MKTLFGFNTLIYFITVIAFIEPITGSIFMLFLGVTNVLQTLVTLFFLNKLNTRTKSHFKIYSLAVLAWLILIFLIIPLVNFPSPEYFVPFGIVVCMGLGAYFLFVNYTMAFDNEPDEIIF